MKKYVYNYDTTFTFEGKRYRVRANTLEELYTKKANKLRDLKDHVIVYDGRVSVDAWAKKALETYKQNVTGYDDMLWRYDKYISPVIGMKQVGQVRAVDCQTIMNSCSGMSFSLVSKLRQELAFIFEKAVDNQLISVNPAGRISLPDYTKGERRAITDLERQTLYKVYEADSAYLFFVIMLKCGCRPEEVINLIGRDIDHETRLLHIRGTKTKYADRYVPIPDDLYAVIRKTAPVDLIAPNRAGSRHTKSSYNRLCNHLKRDMNIALGCKVYRNALIPPLPLADDFVPYDLRHTYCTDLCKAGIDVRTAQKLMGHSNISITANIYTHVDLDDVKNAGEILRQYFDR